jgi:tetratricopeptide (TPR) repeat protein
MKLGAVALLTLALAHVASAPAGAQASPCGSTPYECAVSDVQRGNFDAAVRTLTELVSRTPSDLKALNLLGIALSSAGRPDEANVHFREALRIDPTFSPALKNLAINEFNQGQIAEAERDFATVLMSVPGDEIVHAHLGEIAFERKQCGAALAHYERAGTRATQNPRWALHYATCLTRAREIAAAVTILENIPGSDGTTRFEAGVMLGEAGAYADAAKLFASARKTYDNAYAAAYNETLMRIKAADYDGAIRVAEEFFQGEKTPAELYNLASQAYLKTGRIKEAYDALRAATRAQPDAEENYVDLASICIEHQSFDLALEIIGIGLQYRPDSSILHLQRGVVRAMRAELGAAEEDFDAARRLAPDQAGPYAGLAMIWMQTGRVDTAVDVLRREMHRRDRDHIVAYLFAVALMRSGVDAAAPEAAEAVDALRAAIAANAEFAPAHSELGRLLLKRDDLDEAIRELERAVSIDPEITAALYNLGQAYRRKGDTARATELLARVTRLNAQERGDDPAADLKRTVIRIVREGASPRP